MLRQMLVLACVMGLGIGLCGAGSGCVYHDRDHYYDRDHWHHDDGGWHHDDDDHGDHGDHH